MRSASTRHPAQLNAGNPSRDVQSGLLLKRNRLQLDVVIGAADQCIRPDVAIEFRWANFQLAVLPQLATDLVGHQVAAIVTHSVPATLAAKATTSTIPIVFSAATDPVKLGLVAGFDRPGGNVTGVNFLSTNLGGKRLDLLLKLVPKATTVGLLSGAREFPGAERLLNEQRAALFKEQSSDVLETGRALGRDIIVAEVGRSAKVPNENFEAAFATLVEQRAAALVVGNWAFFLDAGNRDKILELATRNMIPTIYPGRSFVVNGGLMSYDADSALRLVGAHYVAQILKGAKPADLPVIRSTKFELVINLKTAKTLGLEIPPTLFAIADELIE